MDKGYILFYRKIQSHFLWNSGVFSKGQAWVDLLLLANWKPTQFVKRGIIVKLKRGQVGVSIRGFANRWGWSRTKVKLFLNLLKKEHQIDFELNKLTCIVTVLNYEQYQDKSATDLTTEVPQKNLSKRKVKNVAQKKQKHYVVSRQKTDEIITALNDKTGKKFKATTKATQGLINARLKEGFTVNDFLQVIDTKCEQWLDNDEMSIYLRPATLFSPKFEGYLNEGKAKSNTMTDEESKKMMDEFNQHMERLRT